MSKDFIEDGFVYVPLFEHSEPVDPTTFRAKVINDDYRDWVERSIVVEPSYAQDVAFYQAPPKWWPRLVWRVRMLLGRLWPRLRPRPNMVLKGCVPVRYEQGTGTLFADGVQEECSITYSHQEKP